LSIVFYSYNLIDEKQYRSNYIDVLICLAVLGLDGSSIVGDVAYCDNLFLLSLVT
jgi:hypothetical protein